MGDTGNRFNRERQEYQICRTNRTARAQAKEERWQAHLPDLELFHSVLIVCGLWILEKSKPPRGWEGGLAPLFRALRASPEFLVC